MRTHADRRTESMFSVQHDANGHFADFGPTLIVEKLAERHGLSLSRETVRQWMIEDGLWTDRRAAR